MRRFADRVASALGLDERGRRAVRETIADWRHEVEAEPRPAVRAIHALRGAISLLRVGALVIGRDAWMVVRSPLPWRPILLVLVASVVAASVQWPPRSHSVAGFVATAALAPSCFAILLPLGAFIASCWPPKARHVRLIGLTVMMAAVEVLTTGWLIPAANQVFRSTVIAAFNPGASISPGVHELNVLELARRFPAGQRPAVAAEVLWTFGGLTSLSAAATILGGAMRHRPKLARWSASILILPAYMFVAIVIHSLFRIFPGVTFFGLAVTLVIASLVLAVRSDDSTEQAHKTA